jgi:hypothetical protein
MNWTERDLHDEFRAQEDTAPSTLAVLARLDGAAERRRRTRVGWIIAIAAGIVTAAVPLALIARMPARPATAPPNAAYSADPAYGKSTAVAPTSCTVDALPMPEGHHVGSATAIDPSGRYIVLQSAVERLTTPTRVSLPAPDTGSGSATSLWVNGALRHLDVPGKATDVNASGVVVGSAATGPWILRDGHASKLPGVTAGSADAINSTGMVAGTQLLSTATPSMSQPVVWRSPDADPIDLPIPPDTFRSTAYDIDDDGTVVGVIDMGTPNGKASYAHVWFPDGTGRDLLTPPDSGLINPVAFSIRNGWVAGAANQPAIGSEKPPMVVGLRWNLRTGDALVLPPVSGAKINRQGWIIGQGAGHGLLVTDTGTVQLPDLGPSAAYQTLAKGVNDDGRMIVGESNSRPVLWRCE